MLNSFLSVIPYGYWLGNHKILNDGHLLQESETERSGKYFILFFEHNSTPN